MPAVRRTRRCEHATGGTAETDAELAEGQDQSGQSDQDRAGRLQQGDVQVVVRGPDEDEDATMTSVLAVTFSKGMYFIRSRPWNSQIGNSHMPMTLPNDRK